MTTVDEIMAPNKSIVMGAPESGRLLNDDNLTQIQSVDDALALLRGVLGNVTPIDAGDFLGNGFVLLEKDEKSQLIDREFVILQVTKNPSDKSEKGYFYSLVIITRDGGKFIVNDGSTGIADQLDKFYERHPELAGQPMNVRKGLRVSRYKHPEHGDSTTWYLNTSK